MSCLEKLIKVHEPEKYLTRTSISAVFWSHLLIARLNVFLSRDTLARDACRTCTWWVCIGVFDCFDTDDALARSRALSSASFWTRARAGRRTGCSARSAINIIDGLILEWWGVTLRRNWFHVVLCSLWCCQITWFFYFNCRCTCLSRRWAWFIRFLKSKLTLVCQKMTFFLNKWW